MAGVCACGEYFTVNDDGQLCLIPGTMGLREVVYFKTPGAHQFAKADYPWLARAVVRVQGGGGGSAGANAGTGEVIARPGGAGGGYSEALVEAVSMGAVESVVVGAGGAAGAGNSSGGAGGTSSFGGFVVALGGDGGTSNMTSGTAITTAQGITAPLAGSGDVAMGGGAGGIAVRLGATNGFSGQGGESFFGHGGYSRSTAGDGTNPRGYGGGAGGALSLNGSAQNGADGGNGLVVLELYG
jgi:hypothetical protein